MTRSDARKRTLPLPDPFVAVADYADIETERANQAERHLADIRNLARQLLADADTTHPDDFLRGCATGTRDTAHAILNAIGETT